MNTCLNWLVPGGGAGVTVIAAVPLCPSLVAVMVAEPTATPLTTPLLETVATAALSLAHVTVRPVSVLPFASFSVAVSATVRPTATLAVAGLTVTVATGTCTTVIVALPLCPSHVAVIVAEPATFPVTSPFELTVATAVLLLAHVTVRPVNGLPFASFGVAVSCTVLPSSTLADAGVTVTLATGTGVTVTLDVPLFPSLVAVIVAEPVTTPVTSPLPFTVATAVLLLDQVTTRPGRGFPFASFGVAVSCTVSPTCTLAGEGVTVTLATGTGVTVTPDVPLFPSLVAVIVAEPVATPVTSPLPFTVAMAVLSLDQVTTRPGRGFPFASRGVAVSWTVNPTATLAGDGVTVTLATGTGVTVTLDVPLCPSLVAVIVAEPVATPVTSPLPFTVATAVLLLDQVTTRPGRGFPFASFGVAVSCTVSPTCTLAGEGVTVTLATGTGVTVTPDVPLFPSLVAVIVAEPVATPVTSPLPFTVAMAVLSLDQVTTRPGRGFPFASRGVAVSWTVNPTATLAGDGVTVTLATGTGVTVTLDVPLCPSLVAVIVAEPVATPVTSPLPFTVAT